MSDMASTCGWFTQQSHVSNQPTQQQFFVTCQCHQVENFADIPNNSSQEFSMVKIFGEETTQNTTLNNLNNIHMATTNCNWCIHTKSHHEQNQLLRHTWQDCHQSHYHHATEDETNQTFSAFTLAVMPPTNTFSAECTVEDLNINTWPSLSTWLIKFRWTIQVAHIQQSKSQTVASNQTSGSICDA